MDPSQIIGAIEIGTSKVVVLVGEIVKGQNLNIIGVGQSSSKGIKKGEIVDFKSASACTHAAIMAAERNAGTQIETVSLAQTGRHLRGFFNTGSVRVTDSENLVSQADINRSISEAKSKQLPPGRLYIHHIQNPFLLDGHTVSAPFKMRGERLEVGYWHVHGDERNVSDAIHVINGFGLKVQDIILSSIASGCMVASEAERENGSIVIDIGCGSTDYAIYRERYIVKTGVIPVGGDHLTNDLSLGLRIDRKNAEKLKLKFGKALFDRNEKSDKIWLIGDLTIGDRMIKRRALHQIINARIEELFLIIKKQVGELLNPKDLAAGAIITGGTSRLSGIDLLAANVLGVGARLAENPSWVREDLRGPEFSTPLGLLYYALTSPEANKVIKKQRGLFKRMLNALSFR